MSGETFHDIAQPAQVRFDAERHRAPIRSFLVTRTWLVRSRTRRSGDVRGERAKNESTLDRFVSKMRGQSEGDRSRLLPRFWDGEFSLDSAGCGGFPLKRKSAVDVPSCIPCRPSASATIPATGFASY